MTIVLLGVPEDIAAALTRQLGHDNVRVAPLPAWSADVAPADVALIVLRSRQPVADVIAIRRTTATPVLLLTRADAPECAAALDAGADICLGRDSAAALVVAQARALLRRGAHVEVAHNGTLSAGGLLINTAARDVRAEGKEVALAPREFDLLTFMATRPGKALRRDELLANVWGPNYVGDTNTVDVHVAWLRQKLPPQSGVRITTLRGVGYRFDVLEQAAG